MLTISSKNIQILVATHKPWDMPTDNIYLPIHVGSHDKESIGYVRDDSGNHISHLNDYYSELTGLYWAWKNLDSDYLGLVHYRRYLTAPNKKVKDNDSIDSIVLSRSETEKLLEHYDILVPRKRHYVIETLESHYANTLDPTHLAVTREIIEVMYPEMVNTYDCVIKQRSGHMFNMYIAKKEISDAYCTWLFPILEELLERVDTSEMDGFHKRFVGRVSEILFNVWLSDQNYKVKAIPHYYFDKINWFNKGIQFLMAKFFGKKYNQSF